MTSPASDAAVPDPDGEAGGSSTSATASAPDPETAPVAAPEVAPSPEARVEPDRVSVRRAPRISRFVILGAGLGAIVTFILTALFPVDPLVGFGALFGYFLLFGVPLGAGLGAIIAIVLDLVATRRSRQFDAERESVDLPEQQLEGELED